MEFSRLPQAVLGGVALTSVASRYPIHFAVPAWGRDYVETYLDVCLPAQLSSGNIRALSGGDGHRYTIYTREADVGLIEGAQSFHRLKEMLDVRIEVMSGQRQGENKYHVKTECYQHALRAAVADSAALFALNCDMVLADGFVAQVVDKLNRGIRLIEVPGSRTIKSEIVDALTSRYRSFDGTSISVGPKALASLWLQHRHPQLDQHMVQGAVGGPFHPSHLLWNVSTEGVIIRAFHVYPMVTRHLDPDVEFATLDDDLAANMAVADTERYFAEDSRDLFCCELSPVEYNVNAPVARGDIDGIVDFYLSYAKENINNLCREMIVTGRDDLGNVWLQNREAFADFVAEIMDRYHVRLNDRRASELRVPSPPEPTDELSDSDALSELQRLHSVGEHPSAELRERCALIEIARGADRDDLILQLCTALIEQTKHVPHVLEKKALEIHLARGPDRVDLRDRLKKVKSLIKNLS